jgi:hypothetical protein
MRTLATLWVGRLGPIEMASLHSFALQGQTPLVYSYTPVENLPAGVENRDAAEVYPSDVVAHYRREGSPSLHSNFFRYALMRKTDHVWTDLDVIALRPFDLALDRIYAWENRNRVNCAVLRLPRDSPTLAALSELGPETRGVAPHIQGFRRAKYWVRTLGRGVPVDRWPWSSTGPLALTTYLRRFGEIDSALPAATFYPISSSKSARFLLPGGVTEATFPPETQGVHLSGSVCWRLARERHGGRIPEGSFLASRIARAAEDGFAA